MFIQTEETPNPNTLKFLPGKVILNEDSLEFKTKDEAKSNILAESLFEDEDGGDISFVEFKNGIVFLELRGACSGCPSSTITLKSGIENMLKYYIPEIVSVEAINQ